MNCTDIAALSPLYLLGELDASRAAAFQAHVESCRACAREMRQQTEFDSRLRAQADAADREIDTAALDHAILRRIAAEEGRRLPARWLIAAGVTAVLIASTLAYRVWHVPQVSAVCEDAARDHHHEVIDRQPRAWLSDHAQIEELAQRQGLPASAVVSLAASGYRMERGKLCRLDGQVFLHLVYTDGAQEFSVFLRPKDAKPVAGVYTADLGADHLASFQTERLAAIVVTDQSAEAALHLVRLAAGVL